VVLGVVVATRGKYLLPARCARHDVRVLILETNRTFGMCRERLYQTSPVLANVHHILHGNRFISKPKTKGAGKTLRR
jgi:hypothetical protein